MSDLIKLEVTPKHWNEVIRLNKWAKGKGIKIITRKSTSLFLKDDGSNPNVLEFLLVKKGRKGILMTTTSYEDLYNFLAGYGAAKHIAREEQQKAAKGAS